MKRRNFLKKTSLAGVVSVLTPYWGAAIFSSSCKKQVLPDGGSVDEIIIMPEIDKLLYNGIKLPELWPPSHLSPDSFDPIPVPNLNQPPEVIPIDVGRQLWVDDFLIRETTLEREFHKAVKHDGNPILTAERDWEIAGDGSGTARLFSGGVWWDDNDNLFKMWYKGTGSTIAYAISTNGINWNRPILGNGINPGTNIVFPRESRIAANTFMIDKLTDNPQERYKAWMRPSGEIRSKAELRVSADGIHWSEPVETGVVGDRTTMFYNPFRRKWVHSIRSSGQDDLRSGIGRARYYIEKDDFMKNAGWEPGDPVFWAGADSLDERDPDIGVRPQLYNLEAVAYESLMLGIFQMYKGPSNSVGEQTGIPKITEFTLAYSRDGFHWHRPDRSTFINASRIEGDWERGYLQSAGGVCLIVGDELWFYYSGYKGDQDNITPTAFYKNSSTGLAKLRRDGFASLNATASGGTVTTRLVTFEGSSLFVNADCPSGELRAEVLDEHGQVIAPFSLENSEPLSVNKTCVGMGWRGVDGLSTLVGRKVSFRFHLKNGKFYAFWVSPDSSGASHGYVAAGGPGLTGATDTVGLNGAV